MNDLYESMGIPQEFLQFMIDRDHIRVERWGLDGDVRALENWVSTDDTRLKFVRYYVRKTTELGFVYKFPKKYL